MSFRSLGIGLALCDWDGTFCDSRKSIYDMNVAMADFYGVVMPSYEEWLKASHPSVEECMQSIGVVDTPQNINAFFHRLLEEANKKGFQNPLYAGVKDLLECFRSKGIPAIIISRHLHHHLLRDVEARGLSDYFQEIHGEPDGRNLKKDEVMRAVCAGLGVPRDQACYLGDTSHDMRLARQAGVVALGVSHGYDPVSQLAKEEPAAIFGSLPELQAFVESP